MVVTSGCSNPWSMLPKELLEMILARLDLAGHARFGWVCSRWRSVVADHPLISNQPLGPQVLSDNPWSLVRQLLAPLGQFWGEPAPGFIGPRPSWETARLIGGFEGWLAALVPGGGVFLFHPAFDESIPVPRPPHQVEGLSGYKVVMSARPSSSNCTLVLRQTKPGGLATLAFCRPHKEKYFTTFFPRQWWMVRRHDFIVDMVFYRRRLYVKDGSPGNVIKVFDSGLMEEPTELPLPPAADFSVNSLVVSGDRLRAVGWDRRSPVRRLRVVELDPSSSRWVQVGSIGEHNVLLLNPMCSLCLSAKDLEGFRGDTIYYNRYDDDSA